MAHKKWLIIGGAVALVLILGGGAYWALSGQGPVVVAWQGQGSAATPAPTPTAQPVRYPEPGDGIMFDLGTRIVNLLDPVGRLYVKAGIVVEFLPPDYAYYQLPDEERAERKETLLAALAEVKPIMDDLVTTVLTSKTYEDVYTPEGKNALRAELIQQMNERLAGKHQALNLYFTEFIIQ